MHNRCAASPRPRVQSNRFEPDGGQGAGMRGFHALTPADDADRCRLCPCWTRLAPLWSESGPITAGARILRLF
ncbi:unnamed protein product [Boreogadus saida]